MVAYGKILPPEILNIPRYGCINGHASLLPKYRGASPTQWCIVCGERVTGVTVMQMDAGMDTGDILETAKRELYEETGAITFDITPICIYSVTAPDNFDGMETFGKLFFSDIHTFEKELHSEIEKIAIMDELPINWTYPEIQPKLIEEARKRGF